MADAAQAGGQAAPAGVIPDDDLLYRTAFLVVDMQCFDAHRDWGEGQTARQLGVLHHFDDYFAQIDTIVQRIRGLLNLLRKRNMEVMHLRVAEETQDSRDVGLKQLVRGLVVPIDSKEAEFLEGLEPVGDEIVVNKSASGVFAATNLDRLLRNIGIDRLILTGTSTSGCVQSAVYDALDLGYQVFVVDDACADATGRSQADALEQLRRGGVTLVGAAALAERVGRLAAADPARRSGVERARPFIPTSPWLPNDGAPAGANPYALIFGPAIRLDLRPGNTAVVLMDAQGLTCDAAASLAAVLDADPDYRGFRDRLPHALARMRELLEGARRLGLPVLHIRTAGHLVDGRDLSAKLRQLGARSVIGEPDAAFRAEVAPGPGEVIINKPASSIFNGTGLDGLLRTIGAEHIVLAGITVDGAIEASVRSAGDRGYGVLLVRDACAGHRHAEATIAAFDKATVNVATTAQALDRLGEPRDRGQHRASFRNDQEMSP